MKRTLLLSSSIGMALLSTSLASAQTSSPNVPSAGAVGAPAAPTAIPATTSQPPNTADSPPHGTTGALQEVVVTANKRSQDLQRTSNSIAVVSGAAIAKESINTLSDALKDVAGVRVQTGATGSDPVVRGIGPGLPANLGADEGIATNYDGVFSSSNILSRTGYYDVSRIEILRGPQGTLYGHDAEGGVLNVVTADPTFGSFGGNYDVGIGNYDLGRVNGALNMPVNDKLAIRIAGGYEHQAGYLSNGQDDNIAGGARVKVLYQPLVGTSILGGFEYIEVSGRGPGTVPAFTIAPSASVAYDNGLPKDQKYDQDGEKYWSQIQQDLHFATLTILPAYQHLANPDQRLYTKLNDVVGTHDGGLDQTSVETRLASEPSSRIQWLAGYYHYFSHATGTTDTTKLVNGQIVSLNNNDYSYSVESSDGVFAQATIPLYEQLRLIAGVRESWDDKSYLTTSGTSQKTSGDFSHFDYKVGLEYSLTAQSLVYGTVSTGYRPGGISPAPPNPVYQQETLRSYEVGSKNTFLDGKLRLNGDFFYYNYDNYQVPNLVPSPTGFSLDILNLPKVRSFGSEVEAQYRITPHDEFGLSAAYLNVDVESPAVIFFTNLQHKALPNSPDLTGDVHYLHRFDLPNGGQLSPEVDARYSSSFYTGIPPSPISTQQSYWQEDLTLSYTPPVSRYTLTAYVKDLSNEIVKSGYVGGQLTALINRTYGLSLTGRF